MGHIPFPFALKSDARRYTSRFAVAKGTVPVGVADADIDDVVVGDVLAVCDALDVTVAVVLDDAVVDGEVDVVPIGVVVGEPDVDGVFVGVRELDGVKLEDAVTDLRTSRMEGKGHARDARGV